MITFWILGYILIGVLVMGVGIRILSQSKSDRNRWDTLSDGEQAMLLMTPLFWGGFLPLGVLFGIVFLIGWLSLKLVQMTMK